MSSKLVQLYFYLFIKMKMLLVKIKDSKVIFVLNIRIKGLAMLITNSGCKTAPIL